MFQHSYSSYLLLLLLLLAACSEPQPVAENTPVALAPTILTATVPPTATTLPTITSPLPTDVPTPTALPLPSATVDPLKAAVDAVVTAINTNSWRGAADADQFFHGVYGGRVDVNWGFSVPMVYAGDMYGNRELAISADSNTPLPILYEQAAALNPTDLPVSAIVLSKGWGVDQPADALLYFTEQDGEQRWMGAIFSFDGFAPVLPTLVAEPNETVRNYLQTVAQQDAFAQQIAARFDILPASVAINPSQTLAVVASGSHKFGLYNHHVIDLASGEVTTYAGENGRALVVTGNWADDQRLIVKYSDSKDDFPVAGRIALLDAADGTVSVIEANGFAYPPLAMTADGAIAYQVVGGIAVWQADAGKSGIDAAASGSPSISADLRYAIGVDSQQTADGLSQGRYVLHDTQTDTEQTVATFYPPPMGGWTDPAVWNAAGTWAAIAPWSTFAEHSGVTLVEAASGTTRFLGIDTFAPRWAADDLLLFNAYVGDEQQTRLLDLNTNDQVVLLLDEPVAEEKVLIAPLSQEVTIPELNLSFRLPGDWDITRDETTFSFFPTSGSGEIRYSLWAEAIPNPDQLSVAEAYANHYDPALLEEVSQAMSVAKSSYFDVVRSDFIFSADGALGYFFRASDRYILLALTPFNATQPFDRQAEAVTLFETIIDSVDDQYLIGEGVEPES